MIRLRSCPRGHEHPPLHDAMRDIVATGVCPLCPEVRLVTASLSETDPPYQGCPCCWLMYRIDEKNQLWLTGGMIPWPGTWPR